MLTNPLAIREAFQTPALFSSVSEVAAEPNPEYVWIPSNLDPPEHVTYRQLLGTRFAPEAVERLTPAVERFALDLIAELCERGGCDFIADVAAPYPTAVFLHSLALDVADTPIVVRWVRAIFDNLRDPELHEPLRVAMDEVRLYFKQLIADRRANQRDPAVDFVSYLLASTVDGAPLSDDTILNIALVLLMAGVETTCGQLGYMFRHLAEHPEDRKRIREHPDVIPAAVEEFLRIHSIVLPGRKVTQDTDFHGCPMRAGDMVMLTIACANRSPDAFDRPLDVDLDRWPNRHIAFGAGPHRCLGIHLARRELATVLRIWHELIPDYRIDGIAPLVERGGQLGLVSLPLTWS